MWVIQGFPKIRGTLCGVPIIRINVFCSVYWGPLTLGNYHIDKDPPWLDKAQVCKDPAASWTAVKLVPKLTIGS